MRAEKSDPPVAMQQQRLRTEDVECEGASSFNDLLLPEPMVAALEAAGFERPSPVQHAAIPLGRAGSDLIVQAKSGTGKTAVFAVICLDRVRMEVGMPQVRVCLCCCLQRRTPPRDWSPPPTLKQTTNKQIKKRR